MKDKNEKERLYIRTDANASLGIGHVMRCCTIADEWTARGGDAVFLVSDGQSEKVVKGQGHRTCRLKTARWDRLEDELEELKRLIRDQKIRLLLVDSYYISKHYMAELYRLVNVVYLGKFHPEAYPAHMVIDYTIQAAADQSPYLSYAGLGSEILLGCDYFPLRKEFARVFGEMPETRTIEKPYKNVLVLTGGSDPFHVALKLARRLDGDQNYHIHIVAGRFNQDTGELRHISENSGNIFLHCDVKNMAELMKQSDIAVSAGGITLYELCAGNVLTVAYIFADNQIPAIKEFVKQGLMCSAGDIRDKNADEWTEHMVSMVHQLAEDTPKSREMKQKMKSLIDGRGAARIADALSGR